MSLVLNIWLRVTSLFSGFGEQFRGMNKWQRYSAYGLGAVALYLLPYWPDVPVLGAIVNTPGSQFETVLNDQVVIFVLIALGLNVVVGIAGLLDLGYVGFYAVGAYVTAILTSAHGNLPWLLALPIAVVISMLFGLILGTPTLRLRGDYLAIVTLGFGEVIRLTAKNMDWLGASRGISNIKKPPSIPEWKLGPIEFPGLKFGVLDAKPYFYLGLTMVFIVVFILHRLEYSRVGRAWVAIREDEDAAELMGVNTFKFKLWAFTIGAGIGGLAGVHYAGKVGFINPDNFPLQLSILFLAAVVLGGSGNMYGAILGGILVAYMPERLRNFADKRVLVFGIVLVLMMVFRPEGILPKRVGNEHKKRKARSETGEVTS
jgi:branched-chain amino acid transport system permease protein